MKHTNSSLQRHQFLTIVDELRKALGYSIREFDAASSEEVAMEMMYGNFHFSVVHSDVTQVDKVLIECEFGEIPEDNKSSILEKLLRINSSLAEIDGSAFGISAGNEKLVYVLPIQMCALDGGKLLSKMSEIVWHGRRWQESWFMQHENSDHRLNPVLLA